MVVRAVINAPSLADRLAEMRRLRGWSQRKLANIAGVSNATVSRIESGALTSASVTVLAMLADALECDSSLLLVGQPNRTTVNELSLEVFRSLIALSAPGKEARIYPELAADVDRLRRTRVACDFVQALAMAPAILRALAVESHPDETTHVCYDVALSLRMLGQVSVAWVAIGLARQAADIATSSALSPIVTALQSVFAIEDGEPLAGMALAEHAKPAVVDSPESAAGQATLALMEGLAHAHTRRSDGSDQVRRAKQLLELSNGEVDILGTGVFRPSDLDLWHTKIVVAYGDFERAHALAGTPPEEPFTALLWQVNMCTITLRLKEFDQAARAMLTARELAPQLLPGRPETAVGTRELLTKSLHPQMLRQLRRIHDVASSHSRQ